MACFIFVVLIAIPTGNKGLCKIFIEWLKVKSRASFDVFAWIGTDRGLNKTLIDEHVASFNVVNVGKKTSSAVGAKITGEMMIYFNLWFDWESVPGAVRVTEWMGLSPMNCGDHLYKY